MIKSCLSLTLIAALLISSQPLAAEGPGMEGPIAGAVSREAARLARSEPLPEENVQRQNWFARHPVLTGALAGTTVGLAAVGYANRHVDQRDNAWWILAGAGSGALGGLVAHGIIGDGLTYQTAGLPDVRSVKRIVAKLGVGGDVDVTAGGRRMTARIQRIGANEFWLIPETSTTAVPVVYQDVRMIQPKPLGTGTKVGIAAAVGVVLASVLGCAYHCGG
jgi:hypothetical protein